MKLIIDTNVLISSLLKDSATREILLNESIDFYIPEIILKTSHLVNLLEKHSKLETKVHDGENANN